MLSKCILNHSERPTPYLAHLLLHNARPNPLAKAKEPNALAPF